jgi:hypothetical protein
MKSLYTIQIDRLVLVWVSSGRTVAVAIRTGGEHSVNTAIPSNTTTIIPRLHVSNSPRNPRRNACRRNTRICLRMSPLSLSLQLSSSSPIRKTLMRFRVAGLRVAR